MQVKNTSSSENDCAVKFCFVAGRLLRQGLWMMLLLAVILEAAGMMAHLKVFFLLRGGNSSGTSSKLGSNNMVQNKRPKTVFLGGTKSFKAKSGRSVENMWLDNVKRRKSEASDTVSVLRNPKALGGKENHEDCVPGADWQSRFYPTCNAFHEMELHKPPRDGDVVTQFLGAGKQRDAWKVGKSDEAVVLKTLKLRTGFSHLSYYRQILDAIASERVSSSPHVINIYGFCGGSVMNEIGTEFQGKEVLTLDEKIRYARDLSAGMAALHGIDSRFPMVAHGDVRRGNIMFSYDRSVLKLSDFNQGFFLGWNSKYQTPCGYQRYPLIRRRPRDKFSSPEETYKEYLSEKTDVYHLGSVIFFLLTGDRPYAFNDKSELDDAGLPLIADPWNLPTLPDKILNSKDPTVATMRKVMYSCYRYKMENRASAQEVYEMLNKRVEAMDQGNSR